VYVPALHRDRVAWVCRVYCCLDALSWVDDDHRAGVARGDPLLPWPRLLPRDQDGSDSVVHWFSSVWIFLEQPGWSLVDADYRAGQGDSWADSYH